MQHGGASQGIDVSVFRVKIQDGYDRWGSPKLFDPGTSLKERNPFEKMWSMIEFYSALRKKAIIAICSNTDATGDSHTK